MLEYKLTIWFTETHKLEVYINDRNISNVAVLASVKSSPWIETSIGEAVYVDWEKVILASLMPAEFLE